MADPHYTDGHVTLHHGDCLDVLRGLPDSSVDSVVTDPPYGLEFMGREWDSFKPKEKPCVTQPETAPMTPETGVSDVNAVLATTVNVAPTVGASGEATDLARAASATIVRADAIGGFQDGNGGNAYSRSRVRSDTRRHGGDMLTANHGYQSWCLLWSAECLRVLKPGGHLLAFGGTRTYHRLASAIEDAGFEIRDSISWLYGSGFPKSLDVSKAIDKAAGAERPILDVRQHRSAFNASGTHQAFEAETTSREIAFTAPATPDAQRWQGWGTALKPAHEPIVVARKPLAGTVAANVLEHGTGALNVDGCRVGTDGGNRRADTSTTVNRGAEMGAYATSAARVENLGRWPPNVLLDESQAAALDRESGNRPGAVSNGSKGTTGSNGIYNEGWGSMEQRPGRGDSGGASRFFPTFRYEAKAPTLERPRVDGMAHPTTKPLDLMRWLVRLVTPPGGTCLDPFAGSGTTAEACVVEGFRCIAVEREPDYLPLIVARLSKPIQPDMFGGVAHG